MMGLSDSERISMIRSAVLIQSTLVTDRQTDIIAVAYTRILACVKRREKDWKSRMQKKSSLKLYKTYKTYKNIIELFYALTVYFIKISQAGPSARSQFFSGRA